MREIKKPAFMKEAEKTKSHSILGEMIIFIVLYVISIFVEAMALVPGLLVYGLIHPISAGIEQVAMGDGLYAVCGDIFDRIIYRVL